MNLSKVHWTTATFKAVGVIVPSILLMRHAHQIQIPYIRNWKEALLPSDLPDKFTDYIMKIVEDELFIISSQQKYPIAKSKFSLLLVDKFDSQTYSCFDCNGNALILISSRLALTDIKTFRRHYPNLLDLFKGISGSGEKIETAELKDSDLQKLLLSENAKKFAISRELLFAESWRVGMPFIISSCICSLGWLICFYLRSKLGGPIPTFLIALVLVILLHYFVLKWFFIKEMIDLDELAANIDDEHFTGAIEYFESNIELCKFLNRLISSPTNFNAEGNYLQHPILFTERLEHLNRIKKNNKS